MDRALSYPRMLATNSFLGTVASTSDAEIVVSWQSVHKEQIEFSRRNKSESELINYAKEN